MIPSGAETPHFSRQEGVPGTSGHATPPHRKRCAAGCAAQTDCLCIRNAGVRSDVSQARFRRPEAAEVGSSWRGSVCRVLCRPLDAASDAGRRVAEPPDFSGLSDTAEQPALSNAAVSAAEPAAEPASADPTTAEPAAEPTAVTSAVATTAVVTATRSEQDWQKINGTRMLLCWIIRMRVQGTFSQATLATMIGYTQQQLSGFTATIPGQKWCQVQLCITFEYAVSRIDVHNGAFSHRQAPSNAAGLLETVANVF